MTQPRWLDSREQAAWRAYTAMQRRLDAALGQRLVRDSGLSAADYEVLVPLSEAPDRQLRARDLARALDWEKSRLSHHLTRMERRGLVERRECETDARGAFIRLTRGGAQAIEGAAPQHVDAVRQHFIDLLTPQELETLVSISDRVLGSLAAVGCDHVEQSGDACAS
ncbi:MAG: MarR family winged helix-turn-helix transcriptional regulator [Actinomycetes bacterium]